MPSRAELVMQAVNSVFKAPVLTLASDKQFIVRYAPTGVLPIDVLLNGGLPRGRFTTIVGDWSTLKSYIGLRAIAAAQARGEVCALIDTEKAFDPEWATHLGVNIKQLIMPPKEMETGEQAVDYAEQLIRQGVDLIVFDSVSAALPKAERGVQLSSDRNIQPARLATLMSVACRKLTAPNTSTAVLWINQLRMNVGIAFGNPETPTGGRALPYYNSYTLEVKKVGKVTKPHKAHDGESKKDTQIVVAQKFRATLTKSKLSKPLSEAYFDWSYLDGGRIDTEKYLFAQGIEHGLLKQEGKSWTVRGSRNKVIGREKFIAHLRSNDRDRASLEAKVREVHGLDAPRPVKKLVEVAKPAKPASTVPGRTRTVARARSKVTPVRRTSSTSSRTR